MCGIQLFYSFYHAGLRCVNLFIQIYDDDMMMIKAPFLTDRPTVRTVLNLVYNRRFTKHEARFSLIRPLIF